MNNLEKIYNKYKPYKITKKGKCTIIETTSGNFCIKPKSKKNISETFKYLSSRGFIYIPQIYSEDLDDLDVFEYQDDFPYMKEQKALDMIKIVATLHSKTSFYKTVSEDKFKEIYDLINDNLLFAKKRFNELREEIEQERFMSPSHYLFIRNYSKLQNQIGFCETKLDEWYDLVKNTRKIRVCVNHNNLNINHFIKSKRDYLISWDNSSIDSPILDLYNLYKNEFFDIEFQSVFKAYLKLCPLNNDELSLFLIMICTPNIFEFATNEKDSIKNVSRYLEYIYRTEDLVRPYYSENQKE